ncbi:MAG TPA: hypothetical protein VJJ82_02595, partial [Candidatus Nanoarchaeia archaeon]|nr:hypothetical protein [Candidatus Nanoarchaeia archaeon]
MHPRQNPANYSSRPYGKRSHFIRNIIILLIVLFFIPGVPEFVRSSFNFAAWLNSCIGFWTELVIKIRRKRPPRSEERGLTGRFLSS